MGSEESGRPRDGKKARARKAKRPASDAGAAGHQAGDSSGTERGGFLSGLLRPLKKHRVTLTRVGKSVAPMRTGKGSVAGGGKGKVEAKKPAAKKPEVAPSTLRDRQIRELKTLARIGKQNPQRLAGIISKLLMEAEQEERAARAKLEQLIWEKAEEHGRARRGPAEPEGED